MTRLECEDYVYASFLNAEPHLSYDAPDSRKRHPELTRAVLEELSGTHAVVVTGSKGKGSVAKMIADILQTKSRVGLFTSPHLVDFLERFQVDGSPISSDEFVSAVETLKPRFDSIARSLPDSWFVSPMGIQAAVALHCFKRRKTEWNVLECGKGARYDDVNNVVREYSVINGVFLEHTRELGKTLGEIAADKAMAIQPGQRAAFSAPQSPEALGPILSRAKEVSVPLRIYGADFDAFNVEWTERGMRFDVRTGTRTFKNILLPLLGEHQTRNCALALAVCAEIMPDADDRRIRECLSRLSWPGRLEVLSNAPVVLLDACINRNSCKDVLQSISRLNLRNVGVVVGIPDDKDFSGVVREMLPVADSLCLARSDNPHYRFTDMQRQTLAKEGIQVGKVLSVDEFMRAAFARETPTIVLGTTAIVSEVKKWQVRNGAGKSALQDDQDISAQRESP